jgi:DNA-3-methyladenine glycosylase I
MRAYHDEEWGAPSHDDRHLFEMLVLEGAQAGLSWSTILNKRAGYRAAFSDFDFHAVASYDKSRLTDLLEDASIVRNRLKLQSAVENARAVLSVATECGTFSDYVWSFTGGERVVNCPVSMAEVPACTALSDEVSKAMKRRGFRFVGSTIVYSFLQSVGVVDDHLLGCPSKRSR